MAEGPLLSSKARALIAGADTCFIASRSRAPSSHARGEGVDVSHRGGRPGFAQLGEERNQTNITLPDYLGNYLFNTVGNIEADPRVGLLFIDFARGTLLTLTGQAQIVWDGPEVAAVPGAQRLIRFHVSHGAQLEGALPFVWSEPELAPQFTR